jgi:hypothetical protein
MDSKKKRFQEELKRIRQLSAINKVLKKGDVENAFLNNTDKETEISKDTAVERMLEELQADKNEKKDLELLDSLVTEVAVVHKAAKHSPAKKLKPTKKAAKPKRKASKPKKSSKKKR